MSAHQLVLMPQRGVCKTEFHKVHAMRADGTPLCGGGVSRQKFAGVAGGHRPGQLRGVPAHQGEES